MREEIWFTGFLLKRGGPKHGWIQCDHGGTVFIHTDAAFSGEKQFKFRCGVRFRFQVERVSGRRNMEARNAEMI